MHELRLGELAHFKTIPHTPYYGTADATLLYLIVLHAAWMASGDPALLERHLPVAENASRGSIVTATATATAFRNTKPALPRAMRTRAGKTRAKPSSMPMARG